MRLDCAMRFDIWAAILASGLVVFSIVAYRRTAPPLAAGRRALLGSLRAAGFLMLALLVVNPALISTRTETRRALVLVFLDCSRSMGIRDEGGRSRFDAALEDATAVRGELAGGRAEVEVLPFAEALRAEPLPPGGIVAPEGDGTDIRGALEAARSRYPGGVASAVLLSDGRVTRGMVSRPGAAFTRVFTVAYGDSAAPADVSIEEIVADRVAYRGTALRVEAVVRANGMRGCAVEARLLEDGRLKDSVALSAPTDAENLSASFDYVPEREGSRRLTVEATPACAERDRDNNAESIRIDVRREKIRLLFIDQIVDWNAGFLGDLAKRSKRMDADIALGGSDSRLALDPGGTPWTFPASPAALGLYDLVIVADDGGLFDEEANVETLARYVESGGSVLFLADEGSPMARASSCELLERVLPVRRAGALRIEYAEGFVKEPEEALGEPFAAMVGSRSALDAMPPLPARIAGLVPTAGARVPFALGGGAFLAIDRRGEGLAAAILGFPLWRWRLAGSEGARVYESLVGGVVQYLAEGAESPALVLEADRTVYRSGDRIRLTASVGDRDAPESVRGELRRSGAAAADEVSTFVFEPDARRRGMFRAALEGLAPGDYSVVAAGDRFEAFGASNAAAFTVEPLSVEFLDSSRDGPFLDRIAEETGGARIERGALASTVAGWEIAGRSVETTSTRRFRDGMFGLLGVVILLGAEWIARKAWGLV